MIIINGKLEFQQPHFMEQEEVSLALYHIAANTDTSKEFTRDFINNVLMRASEMLARPIAVKTPTENRMSDAERRLREDWTAPEINISHKDRKVKWKFVGGKTYMISADTAKRMLDTSDYNVGCVVAESSKSPGWETLEQLFEEAYDMLFPREQDFKEFKKAYDVVFSREHHTPDTLPTSTERPMNR